MQEETEYVIIGRIFEKLTLTVKSGHLEICTVLHLYFFNTLYIQFVSI